MNNPQPRPDYSEKSTNDTNVFREILLYKDNFFAFGTEGRIVRVDRAGKVNPISSPDSLNLNCAAGYNQMLIVAGDDGTILYSYDGIGFSAGESGTDNDINGIAGKNGLIVAGADNGTILVSTNGMSWSTINTGTKGNIISLTANNSFFIGISDKGEIIRSDDGFNWQSTDYNKLYAGYNKYCFFRKILAGQNSIVIIGTHDDGSPAVLFSTLGNVWTERVLVYDDDNGTMQFLQERLNDITYDPDRDQFVLACDGGVLFTLPTCTKCNTYARVTNVNLSAVAYADNSLAVAGEDYSLKIIRL